MNAYDARAITDRVHYALGITKDKLIRGVLEDILVQVDWLLEKENESWIPIAERLPEQEGHYLVTSELNYYHGGCLDETEEGTSRSLAIAYYDGTDSKHCWNHAHVIAWKSLPDIYDFRNGGQRT